MGEGREVVSEGSERMGQTFVEVFLLEAESIVSERLSGII